MGRKSGLVVVVVALLVGLVAVFAVSSAGAAKKGSFENGLYLGKTSQGEPVKLKVVNCGSYQCVQAQESLETIVRLPCPSIGETSAETFFPADNRIEPNGSVSANQGGFGKMTASLKVTSHGTMTGKIRATETLEDGAKCDSGNVTLKAKIGGSTK